MTGQAHSHDVTALLVPGVKPFRVSLTVAVILPPGTAATGTGDPMAAGAVLVMRVAAWPCDGA